MANNITDLGKVGMTLKGEWSSSTTYERLDTVTYQGSLYVAVQDNSNSVPSENNPNWQLGAKHGEFTEQQLEDFKAEVVAESKDEMDDYTDDKKDELDTYEEAKEGDLDTYTNTKKDELDTYAGNLKDTFDTNATNKTTAFDTNVTNKTTAFNDNYTAKVNAFNTNATEKTTDFNTNATTKTNTFNTNATEKTNAFNTNATQKTQEFNQNAGAIKANVDEIVDELYEDVTVEGSSISITDAEAFEAQIKIKGNTFQENRSGYNKFNLEHALQKFYSSNGAEYTNTPVAYSVENDYIKITGIVSSFGRIFFNKMNLRAGDYTIYAKCDSYEETYNMSYSVRNFDSLTDIIPLSHKQRSKIAINFTLNEDVENLSFSLQPTSTNDPALHIEEIMLLEGTYTVDTVPTYESYGETPSRAIPSAMQHVSGDIEITINEETEVFPLEDGQELMGGDYLADDGIHHTKTQYVFDGTESFSKSSSFPGSFYKNWNTFAKAGKVKTEFLCSHLKYVATTGLYAVGKCFSDNTCSLWLGDDNEFPNATALQTYLAEQYQNGTPVTIEYPLATEEVVAYTPEQQIAYNNLKTVLLSKGANTVTATSDGINPIVEITYKKVKEHTTEEHEEKQDTVIDILRNREIKDLRIEDIVFQKNVNYLNGRTNYDALVFSSVPILLRKGTKITFSDTLKVRITVFDINKNYISNTGTYDVMEEYVAQEDCYLIISIYLKDETELHYEDITSELIDIKVSTYDDTIKKSVKFTKYNNYTLESDLIYCGKGTEVSLTTLDFHKEDYTAISSYSSFGIYVVEYELDKVTNNHNPSYSPANWQFYTNTKFTISKDCYIKIYIRQVNNNTITDNIDIFQNILDINYVIPLSNPANKTDVIRNQNAKVNRFLEDYYPFSYGNDNGTSWNSRINLIHISDNHINSSGALNNLKESVEISNIINPNAYINSGDMTNGGANPYKSVILNLYDMYAEAVSKVDAPIVSTLGNHDSNDGKYDSSLNASVITKQEQFEHAFADIAEKYQNIVWGDAEHNRHYHYLDVTADEKTIRIIALDSLDHADYTENEIPYRCMETEVYSQAQINWLCNTALNVPDDYGIIIVNHFPFAPRRDNYSEEHAALKDGVFAQGWNMIPDIIKAWQNRTTINETYNDTIKHTQDITVNADFSNIGSNAVFVCYLTGHTHSKNVYNVENLNNDDTYNQLMLCEDSSGQPGTALNRVHKIVGTISDNSFSVLSIDMRERKIYRTSYGVYQKCNTAPMPRTQIFEF